MISCSFCNDTFTNRRDLAVHREQKHSNLPDTNFRCGHCTVTFTLAKNLVRHLKNIHKFSRTLRCNNCQTFFGTEASWKLHSRTEHSVVSEVQRSALPGDEGAEFVLERDRKAIRGHFQTYRLKIVGDQVFDPFEYLVTNEVTIRNFITNRLTRIFSAKVGLCIKVKFSKPLLDESTLSFFHSPMETVTTCLTTDEYFAHVDELHTKIHVFCTAGSGWVIEKLNMVEIKFSKHVPLRAGSYIPTPSVLENQRKSLLNIRNLKDNLCFIYSVLAFLFPVKQNQEGPQSYKNNLSSLIYNPRKMPLALSDIPKFEKDNHLKINVYAFEQRKIYPVYLTKYAGVARRVHLLLLSDENSWHYCLIKNLDRLLKFSCGLRTQLTPKRMHANFEKFAFKVLRVKNLSCISPYAHLSSRKSLKWHRKEPQLLSKTGIKLSSARLSFTLTWKHLMLERKILI